jgi:hypothetical protein
MCVVSDFYFNHFLNTIFITLIISPMGGKDFVMPNSANSDSLKLQQLRHTLEIFPVFILLFRRIPKDVSLTTFTSSFLPFFSTDHVQQLIESLPEGSITNETGLSNVEFQRQNELTHLWGLHQFFHHRTTFYLNDDLLSKVSSRIPAQLHQREIALPHPNMVMQDKHYCITFTKPDSDLIIEIFDKNTMINPIILFLKPHVLIQPCVEAFLPDNPQERLLIGKCLNLLIKNISLTGTNT